MVRHQAVAPEQVRAVARLVDGRAAPEQEREPVQPVVRAAAQGRELAE